MQAVWHPQKVSQNIYGDDTTDKQNMDRWMKMFKERETSIKRQSKQVDDFLLNIKAVYLSSHSLGFSHCDTSVLQL